MDPELQAAFDNRSWRQVSNFFANNLKNGDPAQEQGIWDQIGEVCLADPEFFTDKVYPAIQMKVRKLPVDRLMAMDKYILEKYCLFQNESIVEATYANLKEDFADMKKCRLYLTQYRLISSGWKLIKTRGLGSWVGIAIAVTVTKKIQAALSQQFGAQANRGNYGYGYLLTGVYKAKRSAKDISYSVAMDYEEKGKMKTQKLGIKIKPLPQKGQDKVDFANKCGEFLEKLEKSLTQ